MTSTKQITEFTFIAFFKGRTLTVEAPTSYAAQQKAAALFKARKSYDVTVMRADITHNPAVL
jgi:hypothetical protein